MLARPIGATWLLAEIEGLAQRARLALASPRPNTKPSPEEETPFGLTPRELQVLELLSGGCTNREIGERLFMAEKTASVHVSRILSKLDVRRIDFGLKCRLYRSDEGQSGVPPDEWIRAALRR